MAAKNSLRIQITSFAAQTSAREGDPMRRTGSIRVRGGYAGSVPTPKTRGGAPCHRRQLSNGDGHREGSHPNGQPRRRKVGRPQRDSSREDRQRYGGARRQGRGNRDAKAWFFEVKLDVVDRRSASRAYLTYWIDCSSSHIAGATPLAAVLQVLPGHVN